MSGSRKMTTANLAQSLESVHIKADTILVGHMTGGTVTVNMGGKHSAEIKADKKPMTIHHEESDVIITAKNIGKEVVDSSDDDFDIKIEDEHGSMDVHFENWRRSP